MKQMRQIQGPQGPGLQVMMGVRRDLLYLEFLKLNDPLQVLEDMSNAILQDDRIFHIDDQNFIELYNKQSAYQRTAP